jgi:hypothetical protein
VFWWGSGRAVELQCATLSSGAGSGRRRVVHAAAMGSGLRPGTTKKQQAMKLLGLQGDEEAPGIKSAFRRLALRCAPLAPL